jgi:hypothetical protein
MEARIARLESDVSHVRSDLGEIKVDLRALRDKVDSVEKLVHDKFDSLRREIGGLRGDNGGEFTSLRSEIASMKVWGLTLIMTMTGVMLTVMARGFGWL